MSITDMTQNRQSTEFGRVRVSVQARAVDCIVTAPQPCKGPLSVSDRSMRLASVDAIQEQVNVHSVLQRKPQAHPHSVDIVKALRWAMEKIELERSLREQGKCQ
ncbi:hypothetical protein [Epibacterium ulvae]|uniref:hypothetical protein n=1 Tax=Epibacterium ulvae TaxID=1156985 RepID=UPI00248FD92E|nr:hypothetical protein [Epibacterium ulvae]